MNTIKKRLPNQKGVDGHTDEVLCLALSSDFKFLVKIFILFNSL